MKFKVPTGAIALAASALLAVLPAMTLRGAAAFADSSGGEVDAEYKISLNGFDVGTFHYTSRVEGKHYTLASDVELSFLLGAFHWKGVSRTVGSMSDAALSPTGFNFDFTSSLKSGAVRMGFDRGTVSSVAIEPEAPLQPDVVPVEARHLKGVLDPLSAIMVLTRGAGQNPCARRVAIFDGKQRFDLELAFRRKAPLGERGRGVGTVCAIRYIPIAGYRANEDTRSMAQSTGIEITFRPVPEADLQVPHRIVLPTLAGEAEIVAERVNIRTAGQGRLALVD
jgi:hypothetical protein